MVKSTTAFSSNHPIQGLYVFGDSLSDTGRVFRASGGMSPPNPPYFQGRYSNGQVWVEYLAEFLDLSAAQTYNFAYGGATTLSNSNTLVPGLFNQIQLLTQSHQRLNSDALYVIWIGANDYLQGVNNPLIPVENLKRSLSHLAELGAQKLLVANLPDLGQLPATRNRPNSANLSTLSQSHNQSLRRTLKVLNQNFPDLEIALLDAHQLYQTAITNPANFGFQNVTQGCLANSHTAAQAFLFWDDIHPTTTTHRILAEMAFSALQDVGMIQSNSALVL